MANPVVKANKWFKNVLNDFTKITPKYKKVNNVKIGKVYSFIYDAKYKDTLPLWDAFPLSIPIELYPDSFLGLNIHYLPLKHRMTLLKKLNDISNSNYSEKKKFKVSYQLLNGIVRANLLKPTIHRYLNTNIRSKYTELDLGSDFSNIINLPQAKFQKGKPY